MILRLFIVLIFVHSLSFAQRELEAKLNVEETSLQQAFFKNLVVKKVNSNPTIDWVNISPGTSGYCEEFWCHPTDPNAMFSGPDMHAAFGSWDGGASWQTLKDYDGSGLEMRRVIDIQFSLQNPDYGIAFANNQTNTATSGSLYETIDRGRSWKKINIMGKCHSKLAIHPEDDSIWFLGAGDFWNVKANHRSLAKPHGIKQSRSSYGYVWKTTNKGKSWKKVATGLSKDLDVGKIVFDRNNPNTLIMATSHGMFRSTDLGETWISSAKGLPNNLPKDLTSFYNPKSNEFILYAIEQTVYEPNGSTITSKGGAFMSVDSGVSWQSITGNLGLNMKEVTDIFSRDRFHRTVSNWLGISKSKSKETYPQFPNWALQSFNRIVVNPNDKNQIFISHNNRHTFSFGPGGVWKTEDSGKTWTASARSGVYWEKQSNKAYWQSRNNPTGSNMSFSHMQRYMDENDESASAIRMLAINSKGEIYTGLDQQLLKSSDGGNSWNQMDDNELTPGSNQWIGKGNTNLPGRFILTETGIKGRKLLCSGEHGLWQTVDIGDYPNPDAVAVQQIEGQVYKGGAHSIATVAVHPNDPLKIYIMMWRQSHRGKLRRTTNGGKTWENIATIFKASNPSWKGVAYQNSLLIDPNVPDNMYFCATRKSVAEVGKSISQRLLTQGEYGVYRSTDAGYNWAPANNGLPANSSVRRLTLDPKNPNIIYASLNKNKAVSGGLYKSVNGAKRWKKVVIPKAISSVNNFFIDRNTEHMFISAGSSTGDLASGGIWKSEDNAKTWTRIFTAPYVWQTTVSPINKNIIVVSVPAQSPNLTNINFRNPGIYLSVDGGNTWHKINKGLAHSDRIVDVKPDPEDETLLWCVGWGSGWYKAKIDMLLTN